jgi:hypothetical protein
MSDATTARGTGDPPVSRSDHDEIGRHLNDIVSKMVNDHMNWVAGFNNWMNQMLMSMQPVPPQAHAEMTMRQKWLDDFLAQFEPVAAILEKNGHANFGAQLENYQRGFGRLSATHKEVSTAMMKEDAATQRELMKIQSEIAADNLKAGAERHALQKKTNAFVNTETAKGIGDQQESHRKMNESVRKGLFGL